ncbi:glycosyltransferase family 4 protein [Butyrivibrio hungatei]|uniref:Glycosyl transferase GT4 family n=1 Tax=Butyrivibrio hungatei TaxID=185008 RepID=A0A1D9P4A5_9FIRM|nr:glycosyltransferase family 4 protein [Butyrivibrio hungatei]AOZ97437.1 glycosyl transferase GT4 family [Butyrivibrio hungatei]
MKILILTNYANGLYLFRKELVESFIKEGHQVVVSVPSDENCKKLEGLGVEIIETALDRHGMNPAKDIKLFNTYLSMIRKEKPQVVLTYTIKPNIYGAMAAKILKVPYISNITGLGTAIENGGMLSKILIKMYSSSLRRAQKVFFQNEKNMDFMQKHGIAKDNAGLLPGSGVNLTEHPFRDYPSEEDGIRLLAVVRVMRDKGIEEYLNAAKVVGGSNSNVHFELVGEFEEDERDKYEEQIKDLEKQGLLKYYGHLDTVEPVMAKSHVIVHPSYHEGLSNVLLEAAACGRPVLASNVHGCIETFEDGVSGMAFKSQDKEALIDAIKKMLALTKEQRSEMGKKGRKYIEDHFDRNIVINAYKEELGRL